MNGPVSHILLRKAAVKQDWKLRSEPGKKNNGRKVLVNGIYPATETPLHSPPWEPGPPEGKTPVFETGSGGIEIATFNQNARQDRHKHRISTEIYTVLEGVMTIEVEGERIELAAGDELVILPDTIHEVIDSGTEFLTRVHAIACHGDADKYIERDGVWHPARPPAGPPQTPDPA